MARCGPPGNSLTNNRGHPNRWKTWKLIVREFGNAERDVTALDRHPFPPHGWEVELDDTADGQFFPIVDPDRTHLEITEWLDVRYDAEDAEDRMKVIAELATAEPNNVTDLTTPWFQLGDIRLLQLKNPDFRDEREARMIFDVAPRWMFVHHRSGTFGITPYIEVSADSGTNKTHARDSFLREAGRLPILSVTIGPTPLGDEAIASTREFLEFNRYPDVPSTRAPSRFANRASGLERESG